MSHSINPQLLLGNRLEPENFYYIAIYRHDHQCERNLAKYSNGTRWLSSFARRAVRQPFLPLSSRLQPAFTDPWRSGAFVHVRRYYGGFSIPFSTSSSSYSGLFKQYRILVGGRREFPFINYTSGKYKTDRPTDRPVPLSLSLSGNTERTSSSYG